MKISVSSYSFSRLMNSGEMSQLDTVKVAKEMGFDGIEFVDVLPHDGSTVEKYAKKLRAEAEKYDLDVTNFTIGADFISGSNGDTEAEIERVKKMLDIAVLLGVKSVRHDAVSSAGKYRSFDLALPIVANACRKVSEYAATLGIRTMIENHGTFCQGSERVERLFNAVNCPNFGLLADMGNFMCADEAPDLAFGRVAPYAFYAHAKDFHVKGAEEPNPGEGFFRTRNGNYLRGAIIGQGNVPVKHCLTALKMAGYDGYVAIEFEGMEDPMKGIKIGLDNLRRYISEL